MRQEGIKQAEREVEAEERILSDLAWQDVKQYQQQLRDEERKDLSFRLAEAKRYHLIDLEAHREKLDKIHDELTVRHMNWMDDQEYAAGEKAKRRQSVSMRLDSWRLQRMAEEKWAAKKRLADEEDARYREMDWEDLCRAKEALKMEEIESLQLGRMHH
jgi:hypothetical protein